MENINKNASSNRKPALENDDSFQKNTNNLIDVVSSLPELTERKRILDKHTTIATALLKEIKKRFKIHF